jgi:hypothetical protein
MFKKKKWMKPLSRMMIINMAWLAWTVTSAEAHTVQMASLVNPDSFSETDRFQALRNDMIPADFHGNPVVGGSTHWAVREAIQNYSRSEDSRFPERNTIFADAGNFGGFIITYSAVLAGYLVLYVPLSSYGAVKCVFDDDGWNDCWNAYMNRIFH